MFLGLGRGYSNVYGIYTTSNRIVGVKASAGPYVLIAGSTLGVLVLFAVLVSITHVTLLYLPALALIIVLGLRIQSRSKKNDPTSIPELDDRKDFEIFRNNISKIELKNAGLGNGHLRILAVNGNRENFRIGGRIGRGYDGLKSLLQEFCSNPPQIEFSEGA